MRPRFTLLKRRSDAGIPGGGLITLAKSAFNPSDAVANVLQMFSLEAMAKKIKLSCQQHSSLDRIPSVMADEGRFIQVLVNLRKSPCARSLAQR